MKKYLKYILLFALPAMVSAQFSVTSDLTFDYGTDAGMLGLDEVVVFQTLDSTAELSYTFADSSDIEWHYYTVTSDSLLLSSVTRDTMTTLGNLKQGTYELRVNDTVSYYYAVVDFLEYQQSLDSVWVEDEGDSCNTVRLYAALNTVEISVYDVDADTSYVLEEPTTTYMWTNLEEDEKSPSEQSAPLEDIVYECIPFSANFFSNDSFFVEYTMPDTAFTDPYTAIAVRLGEIDIEIAEDDGTSNLLQNSKTSEGSAPFSVIYSVDPEGVETYTSWWVWAVQDGQPNAPTYDNQESVLYTFKTYRESGYRVKVEVSSANSMCIDTATTDVTVYESALEVPNILILGYGILGQFKVAYNSLDPTSFKAAVYDRWGRLVYQWDDPSLGWDGRSPVTNAYVSPGAYYYSIRAEGTDGRKFEKVGDLNVIRENGIK